MATDRTRDHLQEVQKAEIDLMYAVSAGEFPELLMMNRTTSVELLFDRSLVEELAAKIGRKLEIEFDPWEAENKNTEPGAVTKNTAEMTTEKCANMRSGTRFRSPGTIIFP